MNEKRYDLTMPTGCLPCHPTTAIAKVTKEEARAILAQCQKIDAEPEPREWRDGDIVLSHGDPREIVVFIAGKPNWLHQGQSGFSPNDFRKEDDIYVGNLADILAQGPIVVGLTEEDITSPLPHCHKCFAALATYRERKESQ